MAASAGPALALAGRRHRRDPGLALQRQLAGRAAPLLVATFFLVNLVGDHPFAVDAIDKAAATESGSLLNRLLIFGTFALALPLALPCAGAVLRLLLAGWLGGAIVAWSCLSHLWASHPDLTIRRGIAFAVVYLTMACLVATARSTVNLFKALAAVVAVITLLNIFVMLAMPAVSWSPIGENGIFDAKNTAGTVGMLTVVMLGVVIFLARDRRLQLGLAAIWLLSWVFLVLTRSKTSIGLAVLISAGAPLLYLLLRRGSALRFVALLLGVLALFGGLVATSSAGITETDLRLVLFGDLTFSLRTPIWADVVLSIGDRPWLGHGFGSFWDIGAVLNPLRHAPWDAFYVDAQVINTAHNGYLDQFLQTGAVGFALGIAAVLRCLFVLWQAGTRTRSEAERIALVGCICVAMCLALNNLLESYLFRTGDGLGYLFSVVMLQAEQTRLALRREMGRPAGGVPSSRAELPARQPSFGALAAGAPLGRNGST